MTSAVGGYAFGDSAPAARRLGLLADLFEPASRPFLPRFADRQVDLAVDLGCGTGHTTRLLAAVLRPRRTMGLDQSASFVALAAADAPPAVEFAVHDVTQVPFPCPPADLVSCRLQLGPGGLLLVDEVEHIHTTDPALGGYLDIAAALLASRGQTLEIGPVLHRLPDPPGLTRRHDQLATLTPPAAQAAAMFAQNLAVWRDSAVSAGLATETDLNRLATALAEVEEGEISWELRQLAFQRA